MGDVSADEISRVEPGKAAVFGHFITIDCRNDKALSQLTAWTDTSGPDDPRVGQLFKEASAELFSEALGLRPQNSAPSIR